MRVCFARPLFLYDNLCASAVCMNTISDVVIVSSLPQELFKPYGPISRIYLATDRVPEGVPKPSRNRVCTPPAPVLPARLT